MQDGEEALIQGYHLVSQINYLKKTAILIKNLFEILSKGPYCLSDFTCRYLDRILADEIRMATFHWIRDFLAERFSSLALSVFKSNLEIGLITKVPGFDDVEWQDTPNGKVFASNMVVSCDGFYNEPHTDHDHTRYAFGINCLIDRETGKPYQLEGSENKGSIVGSLFVLKDFDIAVDYDRCDGIYETVWDSQVRVNLFTDEKNPCLLVSLTHLLLPG